MNVKEYMDKITSNFNNVEDKYKLREDLKYNRYIRLIDVISRIIYGFECPKIKIQEMGVYNNDSTAWIDSNEIHVKYAEDGELYNYNYFIIDTNTYKLKGFHYNCNTSYSGTKEVYTILEILDIIDLENIERWENILTTFEFSQLKHVRKWSDRGRKEFYDYTVTDFMNDEDYNKIEKMFNVHKNLLKKNKTAKKIIGALDIIEPYWEVCSFEVVENFGKRLKGNFNNYDIPNI